MSSDDAVQAIREQFEISTRFREMIEKRILRLEADAASDEAVLWQLENSDHIRRHLRLVSAQREEAARMRRFLRTSSVRATNPANAL